MRTREQFLRERRSGIGGSDVSAIAAAAMVFME